MKQKPIAVEGQKGQTPKRVGEGNSEITPKEALIMQSPYRTLVENNSY